VRESGGRFVTVSDIEILKALALLGRLGIFAEPAGAAAYAGLLTVQAAGWLDPESTVLCSILVAD